MVFGSREPLTATHDVALLDLDGVVYVGGEAVAHASDALSRAREAGMRLAFVTNNAARPPGVVAEHLTRIGVPATPDEVVTSAQAAARTAAETVPRGSRVMVVGGPGLREALAERGLVPVDSLQDGPAAVVQGFDPEMTWRRLADGAYAIETGIPWIASNADLTIPTPQGRAPGNGTLIAMLATTTGRRPLVVGKPEPPMHREAIIRSGARRPLVVGDRLDTDIEGANRAAVDSLLVFTGVTDPAEVVLAPRPLRPTLMSHDLRGLLTRHPSASPAVEGSGWQCGGWHSEVVGHRLHLAKQSSSASQRVGARWEHGAAADEDVPTDPDLDPMDAVRAACAAVWSAVDAGGPAPSADAVADQLARVAVNDLAER